MKAPNVKQVHPHLNSAWFQRVVELSPDTVYVYDLRQGRLIYANRDMLSLLGYTPEQVKHMDTPLITHLLHPDDQRSFLDRFDRLNDQEVVETAYRLKDASGQWRRFRSQDRVFARDADGTPIQVLGSVRDLSAETPLAEIEWRQIDDARQSELMELKNRFMATVSHEFRTPMASILASTELLERYFEQMSAARRNECLATIKTQIMHLRSMMDDISLVMESATHLLDVNPVPIDVAAFCRDVVEDLSASIGHTRFIELTCADGLGSALLDTAIVGRILSNILLNAVKYSPADTPIYVDVLRQDSVLVFRIQDEGIGIPAAEQKHIWDTFYRAANVGNIGGTGLGLKIVRDYVSLLKGTVTVDSDEGAGSTFTVCLPVGG